MSAEETGQPAAPDAREMKKLRRSAARLHAVQALFQMEHSSLSADQVREEFLAHRFGLDRADQRGFVSVVGTFREFHGPVARPGPIDQALGQGIRAQPSQHDSVVPYITKIAPVSDS